MQEAGTVIVSYRDALLNFVKALGIARIYAWSTTTTYKKQGIEHLDLLTGELLKTLSEAIINLSLKKELIDHSTAAMLSIARLLTTIEIELSGTSYADKLDEFLKTLIAIAQEGES